MKKLTQFLALSGMAFLLAFTACKKDDTTPAKSNIINPLDTIPDDTIPTGPIADATINILSSATGSSITEGTILILTLDFKGNAYNKLKSYTISSSQKTSPMATASLSDTSVHVIVKDTPVTGNAVYTVILSSDKGEITKSYSITVTSAANQYTIETDAPSLGNQASSDPQFWSAKRKNTYKLTDAVGQPDLQADLDFAFCSRSTGNGGNKLISPSSQDATDIYSTQWSASNEKITNWTKRSSTQFIKTSITGTAFQNATSSDDIKSLINQAISANEPNLPSLSVNTNEVYLFKTEKGNYGLIYVYDVTGGVTGTGVIIAGDIQFNVKYQRGQ